MPNIWYNADIQENKQCDRLEKLTNTDKKRDAFITDAILDIVGRDNDKMLDFKKNLESGDNVGIEEFKLMFDYLKRLENRKKIIAAKQKYEDLLNIPYAGERIEIYGHMIK